MKIFHHSRSRTFLLLLASLLLALVQADRLSEEVNSNNSKEEQAAHLLLRQTAERVPDSTKNVATLVSSSQRRRKLQDDGLFGPILTFLLPFIDLFLDPCGLVNEQFPEFVTCECTGSILTTLDYTCSFEQLCVSETDFCAVPRYSGQLTIFELTSVNEVCIADLTIAGILPVGDLCVEITFDPNTEELLSCEARFLDLVCLSCTPCPDGGISLLCSADGETDCFDLLGGLVASARDGENLVEEPALSPDLFWQLLLGNRK